MEKGNDKKERIPEITPPLPDVEIFEEIGGRKVIKYFYFRGPNKVVLFSHLKTKHHDEKELHHHQVKNVYQHYGDDVIGGWIQIEPSVKFPIPPHGDRFSSKKEEELVLEAIKQKLESP